MPNSISEFHYFTYKPSDIIQEKNIPKGSIFKNSIWKIKSIKFLDKKNDLENILCRMAWWLKRHYRMLKGKFIKSWIHLKIMDIHF